MTPPAPLNLRHFEVRALVARGDLALFRPIAVPAGVGSDARLVYEHHDEGRGVWVWQDACGSPRSAPFQGLFSPVGDRRWIRETHFVERPEYVLYKATEPHAPVAAWSPASRMPLWASRGAFRVTAVRALRARALTVDDVRAVGAAEHWDALPYAEARAFGDRWTDAAVRLGFDKHAPDWRGAYATLWDRYVVGRRAHFVTNPWLWQIHGHFEPREAPR